MPYKVRRIVTGHNAAGQADVTFDGDAAQIRELPGWPGLFINELWVTEESPADTLGSADRALRPIRHDPAPNGTIFRVIEIPPEQGLQIDAAQTFSALGSANQPTAEHKAKHPGMHRTDSIDYVVVLGGEGAMVLDTVELKVRQGDCIVQRATSHAWVNQGSAPFIIAVVLIDAQSLTLQESET
jgi:oxalate decarboxylase/phosphoglucose isomerase-like protein (cupin superfamily)